MTFTFPRLHRVLPLGLKIAIPLVALSIGSAALLGTTMIAATRKSFAVTYAAQAEALAQLVGTGYAKDPQDLTSISTLLTDIWASVPTVRRIRIYRQDGDTPALWASTDPSEVGSYRPKPQEVAPITTGTGFQQEELDNGERVLETIEPVRVGARQIVGSVGVFTSVRERDEAVGTIARHILLVATLGVTSQLAALWAVLLWLVLSRTARLARVAAQVARGDLSVRIPEGQEAGGSDELFNVAREFDHMLSAVRDRTRQQEAVTRLGQRALEGAELSALLDEAGQLVAQNLAVEHVAILKVQPQSDTLLVIAGVGWKEGVVGEVTAASGPGSLAGYVIASGEPVIVPDLRTEIRFTPPPTLLDHKVVSCMSVVIPGQDAPYGVLSAHATRPRTFTRDDVHFLQAMANTLGWAIRHKYSQEQLREARVLEMIVKSEPLENIMNTLVGMVESQRPGALCAVLLKRNAALYSVAGRGLPAAFISAVDGTNLGPDAALPAIAAHRGEAVIVQDIANDPVWREKGQLALSYGLRACWAVPIASGAGAALGVFAAFHREPRTPSAEDMRLLGAASYLATIAVEQESLTAKLSHQAHHDALTGLPNRLLFEDRLQQVLALAQRSGQLVGLLFIDLDNFKRVNDTLGHAVGDVLLQYVAQRLQGRIRQSDTLARMGGDEFAVILTGLKDPKDAVEIAQKLLDALTSAFEVEGYQLFVNGSIGISLYPQDGVQAPVLERNADTARYRAKSKGPNSFQLFTPEMHEGALEQLELENSLRRAVDYGEFSLHYQPQFQIDTGKPVGLEALLRWKHPKLGMVPPARFILIAEESGLIVPIGTWVLREACRQNAAWQRAGHQPYRVAVNVSALQFVRPDFVDTVSVALEDHGLEPRWLELELTESVVMRDVEDVRLRLGELRRLGVGISIDDFCTGYSSLAYLQQLPIDSLKIDSSFIRNITTSAAGPEHGPTLVRTIVMMAHSLGIEVVAEGVETVDQLAFLRTVDCDRGQGYLVAKPMPADQVVRVMEPPAEKLAA